MEWLYQSKRSCYRLLAHILFAFCPFQIASAFELLSEGAMDSVSAVSAESAEDIINIAGAPSAGLTLDGYEKLPFETRISVSVSETDEVSEELDFKLVREVEDWADGLRERLGSGFEVGYVDELPQSNFQSDISFDDYSEEFGEPEGSADSDQTRYEISRINQTFELINSGVDSITYRFERYIERAATIDADPFDNGRVIGSGYISDLRSSGENTLTSIRDEDKPLF